MRKTNVVRWKGLLGVIILAMPLSLLVAGPISDVLGIRFWYVFGGTVCILMTVIAFFIPAIMNIEDNHNTNPVPVTA